jgi:hypothetical protein
LLSIRTRGTYARLLEPLEKGQQTFWEGLNYGLVVLALVAIGVVWTVRRRSEQPMALVDSAADSGEVTAAQPDQPEDGS